MNAIDNSVCAGSVPYHCHKLTLHGLGMVIFFLMRRSRGGGSFLDIRYLKYYVWVLSCRNKGAGVWAGQSYSAPRSTRSKECDPMLLAWMLPVLFNVWGLRCCKDQMSGVKTKPKANI